MPQYRSGLQVPTYANAPSVNSQKNTFTTDADIAFSNMQAYSKQDLKDKLEEIDKWKKVAKFSETLAKGLLGMEADKQKEITAADYLRETERLGLGNDSKGGEVEGAEGAEGIKVDPLNADQQVATELAKTAKTEGASPLVTNSILEMNGFTPIGVAKARFEHAEKSYKSKLTEYAREIPLDTTPKIFEQLTQQFGTQYLKPYVNMKPELQLPMAKTIIEENRKLLTERTRQYAIDKGGKTQVVAIAEFQKTGDVDKLHNTLSLITGPKGDFLTFSEQKKIVDAEIRTKVLEDDSNWLNTFLSTPIPKGRPGYKEGADRRYNYIYEAKVDQWRREKRQNDHTKFNLDQKDLDIQRTRAIDEARKYFKENPQELTEQNVEAFQKEIIQITGYPSKELENLLNLFSPDNSTNDKANMELFHQLRLKGELTYEMLTQPGVSKYVYDSFINDVRRAEKAKSFDQVHAKEKQVIKTEIAQALKLVADQKLNTFYSHLSEQELTSRYINEYNELLSTGEYTEEQAKIQALKTVVDNFKGSFSKEGDPFQKNEEGFPNLFESMYPELRRQSADAEIEVQVMRELVKRHGLKAFDKPGLLGTEEEVEGMTIEDPQLKALSRLYGINPLEILNRQRQVYGIDPIEPPEIIKNVQATVSPDIQKLLQNPTVNRLRRVAAAAMEYQQDLTPFNRLGSITVSNNTNSTTVGGYPMHMANIPSYAQALTFAILGGEGGWDSVNPGLVLKGLSNMTADKAWERAVAEKSGSSAMGAMQHLPIYNGVNVLKQRWEAAGLNWKTDKFSPENQVKMNWHFIKSIYPGVEKDLAEGNLRKVMSRLRGTWPSIPGGSQENAHSSGFEGRYYGYLKSLQSMGELI